MKRYGWFGLAAPFALLACQAGVADEVEGVRGDAAVDVEGAASAETLDGPWNCVGRCVWFYRACIKSGGTPGECAPDRDSCIEECHATTCEPGDIDCCGFPGAEC